MQIRVTSKHIKRGKPQQSVTCPIALAVAEKLHKRAGVDQIDILYRDVRGQWYSCKTPDIVAAFIEDFDIGKPVKPFTFKCDFHREDSL